MISSDAHLDARWEHFEHPADIGVRGYGSTPAQAFEQAAAALFAIVVDLSSVELVEKRVISCVGPSPEELFVNWLNELIFVSATENLFFGSFSARIEGRRLEAELAGDRIDALRHQPVAELKAATRAELKVVRQKSGIWLAQCIVDV